MMDPLTFEEAAGKALAFRKDRDWEQFHNPKDLAISISLEASELLEVFQWSGSKTDAPERTEELADELADVMIYCIYMADAIGLDIPETIEHKIAKNGEKYPVDRARGSSSKYTEFQS